MGFPGGSEVKVSASNVGDLGSTPGVGKIPWKRKWLTHSSILAWRIMTSARGCVDVLQ